MKKKTMRKSLHRMKNLVVRWENSGAELVAMLQEIEDRQHRQQMRAEAAEAAEALVKCPRCYSELFPVKRYGEWLLPQHMSTTDVQHICTGSNLPVSNTDKELQKGE